MFMASDFCLWNVFQVFPAPEDYKAMGATPSTTLNADVERVRRYG